MRARKTRQFLIGAVAALLAFPAAAGASPGYAVKEKSLRLRVEAPASKGWSAWIHTAGHHQVTLTAVKGDVIVIYTTLGTVSRKGIEASFGRYGEVSLRFHAKPEPRSFAAPPPPDPRRRPKSRCKGRRPVSERGVFHGGLLFEGEHGFTRVRAHRLSGSVTRAYRQVCKSGSRLPFALAARAKDRDEVVVLGARARAGGVERALLVLDLSLADENGRREGLSFDIASRSSRVGRVAVAKLALVISDEPAVTISPRAADPLSAEVGLETPFEGTASYLAEGDLPPTWTGSLGIRLPGEGLVPLTGPEFETVLCRASGEREFDRCEEELSALEPFYGNGSHSQPLALARLSSLR